MVISLRNSKILGGINLKDGRYLEIGPLYRPLITKSEGQVYYLDHCSGDELRAKYNGNREIPIDQIVDPDIISNNNDLYEKASAYGPYRGVVASHVIEHVPNLIQWLKDIYNLLEDDGILHLAAPDKRFTFDILRRSSTLKDVIEAYEENRWRPSLDLVCDSYRNSVGLTSDTVWSGNFDLRYAAVGWPSSTVAEFIGRFQSGEYVDVHCWVFTPWEFISLIRSIVERYNLNFEPVSFYNTEFGEEEFFFQMRKTGGSSSLGTTWNEIEKNSIDGAKWPTGSLQSKILAISKIAEV